MESPHFTPTRSHPLISTGFTPLHQPFSPAIIDKSATVTAPIKTRLHPYLTQTQTLSHNLAIIPPGTTPKPDCEIEESGNQRTHRQSKPKNPSTVQAKEPAASTERRFVDSPDRNTVFTLTVGRQGKHHTKNQLSDLQKHNQSPQFYPDAREAG